MVQAIVRILLFATPLRLILAASTLWKDWDQQDLDYALEINARNLVVFSSRTFEPIQPFHQSLEDLTIDPHLTTKIHLIDCDVKGDLCKSHDVNEYPAIRLLKVDSREENDIKTVRYRGRRTVQAIRSFLRKHDHPLLLDVSSKDELDNFKRLDDVVIVAFLSGQWGKATEIFYSIAENRSESFVFGYTYNQQSASEEGVSVPAIVCYKNIDGDHQIFEGPFTEENIEMFLATAPEMVMRDFKEREIDTYMKRDKLSAYVFATTETEAKLLRHELTPIARKLEQYVTFGVADAVEYAPMAKNFGLMDNVFPALAVHAPMNDHVFTYLQSRDLVASHVDDMLMTILQGKAASGQVFGDDAPLKREKKRKASELQNDMQQRDEL